MKKCTDDELREKTKTLKKRVQEDNTELNDILIEAFAVLN